MSENTQVRRPSAKLESLTPYDPRYLPAEVMLSANENPRDIDGKLRLYVNDTLAHTPMNRYPDPLANDLRDIIAEAHGLTRDQVLVGNGGDELLFDVALAWGGPDRAMLNFPPTFSVYAQNARLTETAVVDIPRCADFSIDEDAAVQRVAAGDIDFAVVCSPNNPTGNVASPAFIERLLDATDALVVVDEAYGEFCGQTVLPLLKDHDNLLILHTLSKAYAMAGVRVGYVLGSPVVIRELLKVRQPYSVDVLSQAVARCVFGHRECFVDDNAWFAAERDRVFEALQAIAGITPYPSGANFVLFRVEDGRAADLWDYLYEHGVLIRDFSATEGLADCFRVTVGTREQNERFLATLTSFMESEVAHD